MKIEHVPRIAENANVKFSSFVVQKNSAKSVKSSKSSSRLHPLLKAASLIGSEGRNDSFLVYFAENGMDKVVLDNSDDQQIVFHGRSFYGLLVNTDGGPPLLPPPSSSSSSSSSSSLRSDNEVVVSESFRSGSSGTKKNKKAKSMIPPLLVKPNWWQRNNLYYHYYGERMYIFVCIKQRSYL
jgi:hypothetical protein